MKNFLRLEKKFLIFLKHYTKMVFEDECKAKHGTGLKVLTPKQIFQRLPIALAQVKAGKNSENLLNEMRQNFFSLNQ